MKIFHWRSHGIDLLVCTDSEDMARGYIITQVKSWRWQDPEKFDAVLADLQGPPLFVADAGHVITIEAQPR